MIPPVVLPCVLTPEECIRLKAQMDEGHHVPVQGRIPRTNILLPWHYIHTIPEDINWVSERVWSLVSQLEEFGAVVGFDPDSPRCHIYHAGDRVSPHCDNHVDGPPVRLSVSLLVYSDTPGEEDALRIYDEDGGHTPIVFEPGTVVAFAGEARHEVLPTVADRYAVVYWLIDPSSSLTWRP